MPICKGCGAEIIFIKMPSGKLMPCDARPIIYWEEKNGQNKVVTPNGEIKSCKFTGDPSYPSGIGYIPHWATCPAAEQFKIKEARI